jgi:maltose alpha-D-glucosyltransferase/alpha-amylase
MLLAEANQWPEDAIEYFGDGDECHMAFHFPIMPRLFMSLQMEDRFPIVDILNQTPDIPESAQWAIFLRNHDELTLEMVTDEERDYMYRVYAADRSMRLNLGIRRRLAPLLGNDRKKIELMNALLFSLPGSPVIYYGDEIGMGDNYYLGDRNGVRTPMQWNGDRNAGFSRANPQKLLLPVIIDPEYHFETVNVEAQQNNPHSLLWWMKRLIALKKQHPALGRGSLKILKPRNHKVFVFTRELENEIILVLSNLSRFTQYVELDLSDYRGRVPVELFGRTDFPRIGRRPYLLTLGPHSFYWFTLETRAVTDKLGRLDTEAISVTNDWTEVLAGDGLRALELRLPRYLEQRRWFGGKARSIKATSIHDILSLSESSIVLTLLRVDYRDGGSEHYLLPLSFTPGSQIEPLTNHDSVLARVAPEGGGRAVEGLVHDATTDPGFGVALLETIAHRRRIKGRSGTIQASTTKFFRQKWRPGDPTDAAVLHGEQSNTSIAFGDRLILKLYRRLEYGMSLDLEIGRFLTQKKAKAGVPAVAGSMEYRSDGPTETTGMTVAVLQEFVPNEGDAWSYTLDWLARFFERVLTGSPQTPLPPALHSDGVESDLQDEFPDSVLEWLGGYLESARLLGLRTAELHRALASSPVEPEFAPEPITGFYQRSLYQSARNLTGRVFRLLRERVGKLRRDVKRDAEAVLAREEELLTKFGSILDRKVGGRRIRVHGDFHLGQVLYTGRDFVIIDFEGEPARPLSERRIKRAPLRDVAGMLRSFHYAAYAALPGYGDRGLARFEDLPTLEPWARFWSLWASKAFTGAYMKAMAGSKLLPSSPADIDLLMQLLVLEKTVYELGYELNNRPGWLKIPAQSILAQLDGRQSYSTERLERTGEINDGGADKNNRGNRGSGN